MCLHLFYSTLNTILLAIQGVVLIRIKKLVFFQFRFVPNYHLDYMNINHGSSLMGAIVYRMV